MKIKNIWNHHPANNIKQHRNASSKSRYKNDHGAATAAFLRTLPQQTQNWAMHQQHKARKTEQDRKGKIPYRVTNWKPTIWQVHFPISSRCTERPQPKEGPKDRQEWHDPAAKQHVPKMSDVCADSHPPILNSELHHAQRLATVRSSAVGLTVTAWKLTIARLLTCGRKPQVKESAQPSLALPWNGKNTQPHL